MATARMRSGERLGLYVDVPTDPAYAKYELKLVDPLGNGTNIETVSYSEAQKTVVLDILPGAIEGTYQVVITGVPALESEAAKATTLANLKFTVEFLK